MGRPFKCPYCGASATVSKGIRRTKTMGDRRIRRCKGCRRKFTPKRQHPQDPDYDVAATATDRPAEAAETEEEAAQAPAPDPEWTS